MSKSIIVPGMFTVGVLLVLSVSVFGNTTASLPAEAAQPDTSHCPKDAANIDKLFRKGTECMVDEDCTVFTRICDPYATCGTPVSISAFADLTAAVDAYVETCAIVPVACLYCAPTETAVCDSGECVLQ